VDLLDTIERSGADPAAQALALDELVGRHVAPFYEDQAIIDYARLTALRHTIFGAPAPDAAPAISTRVTYGQLRAAAALDPVAFRAFWKIMGMQSLPEEIYTDPQVVAGTRAVLEHQETGPPVAQPTREELLTALAG
jgi:hypothetical protein